MTKTGKRAALELMAEKTFRSHNTDVIKNPNGEYYLTLYGNPIAKLNQGELSITTAGWKSRTTLNRLNCLPNVSISYKNKKLTLNGKEWNGDWITITNN